METQTQVANPPLEEKKLSGLALLDQDPNWMDEPVKTQVQTESPEQIAEKQRLADEAKAAADAIKTPIIEPTPEEKAAQEAKKAELQALGLNETATEAEINAAKAAQKPIDDTWSVTELEKIQQEEEGNGWKTLASTVAEKLGLEAPTDIADTDEAFYEWQTKVVQEKIEAAQKFDKDQYLATLKPEARLAIDLMNATGKSLDEINAPFVEVQRAKAMSDEELVKQKLELKYKDPELVDRKLQEIITDGALEIEGKIIRRDIDAYEQQITTQRQQELKQYTEHQNQVREAARQKDAYAIKQELSKVSTFMDRKLPNEVKDVLFNELTSGKYDNMPGTPAEKIDYALYRKFGKQGLEYAKARAIEQATLQKAKDQYNVPIKTEGEANRVTPSSDKKGLSKLEDDPRFRD